MQALIMLLQSSQYEPSQAALSSRVICDREQKQKRHGRMRRTEYESGDEMI